MTLENKIAIKENRLSTLRNSDKENTGVQRKLEREIRNLKKQLS